MKLYLLLFLLGVLSRTATGIDLSEDGGYSFTLAVDKETPEPANVGDYIGNLKRSLQEFSNVLFTTTNKFHVKSVDILIPDTWESVEDAEGADVTASYETSELRLSDQIKYASVENPNPCGLPGDHISLPATFFADGKYGLAWKALLPLWARYRWGVWEEHGHPSSSRYPYFSKAEVYSQEWTATGCSDEELHGSFLDQHGDPWALDPAMQPEEGCRFHPAPGFQNNATSSLMHFHWLDSVTKFCDETTHNHYSPNRQNLLCNQKSVLEIVRQSSDYEAVTSPPTDPIELIQFRILKPSTTPYLYFLIDKARPEVDVSIVNAVFHGLVRKFFQPNDLPSVVAGLGTFPVTRPVDGATLNAEIAFTELESNLEEFVTKLGDLSTDGDEVRDFATPIIEVVRMIRAKRPVGGGVIFYLKTGGADLTPLMAYEEETAAILRNEQIQLISLELGSTHLENFSEKSGSILRSVNSLTEVDDTIDELLELVKAELGKKVDEPAQNVEVLFRGSVNVNIDLEVSIPEHVSEVEVHLVLPANAGGTSTIRVSGDPVMFLRNMDWAMSATAGSRQVLTVTPPLPANDESVWTFRYECAGLGCIPTGQFLIYGVSDRSASGLLAADQDIQITVSTSARQPDHVIDFEKTVSTLSPFGIYAKVTLGGIAVRNVRVVAHLEDQDDGSMHDVLLLDNGFGTPDVDVNDGIYSGNFIPAKDGLYKVSVSGENAWGSRSVESVARRLSERLLPIDQTEPERESVEVDGEFLQNAQLPDLIRVINTAEIPENYQDKPFKILDVSAQPSDEGISVTFTVPQTPGSSSPQNLEYDVYASTSPDSLEVILANQAGEAVPGSPQLRRISVASASYQGQEYVAVKSKNGATESEFSNIIKIGEQREDGTTTPGPTGPTDEPPTEGSTQSPPTGPTDEPPTEGSTQSPPTDEPPTGPTNPPPTGGPTDPPPTGPTNPPEESEDDDKPFFKTAGGIVVIVLIVLILAGAVGGGAFFYMKRRNRNMEFGNSMDAQERQAAT